MHPATVIQSHLDDTRLVDLERIAAARCTVLTCERSRYWRGLLIEANDENEQLHLELQRRGIRLAPR